MGQRSNQRRDHELSVSRDHVEHRRRGAFIGHVHHLDFSHRAQDFRREVAAAAASCGTVVEFARALARKRDQLFDRPGGQRRVDVYHQRLHGDLGDRREILDGFIRQLAVERGIDDMTAVGHQQRIAVGRGLGDELCPDHASRAGPVLDDDLLPEAVGHFLRDDARQRIDTAAGGARHDHAHRLDRITLRGGVACRCKNGRRAQPTYCGAGKSFHVFSSSGIVAVDPL